MAGMESEGAGRAVGQCALVTGGTGSFGGTMVRQLLKRGIAEVRVLSRDEAKQDDMRRDLADSRARFYIGDVRDGRSVDDAMQGVQFVFHAAALKQVPSCEFFPLQAVATNIQGTDNVIRSAAAHGVESVVCLSTDKAVHPINAMGMSKALMEKVVRAFARNNPRSRTVVSCVRYGNVMYSRGSGYPCVVARGRGGQPLTVTNSAMTRFLMTIAESVDLVEYAFTRAEPGDLFVRKAPASTVGDLATAVARIMGVEPEIRIIGDRHGEKLHETLLSSEELGRSEDRVDYFRVTMDDRSLNYSLYFDSGRAGVQELPDYTSGNTRRLSVDEVEELVRGLPEMQHVLGEE